MKHFHNVRMSVFIKPEDRLDDPNIESKLLDAIKFLYPNVGLDDKEPKIFTETVEGLEGRKIEIIKLDILKEAHTNFFLKNLLSKLTSEQKDLIVKEADLRVDDNLDFFIRFDKKKLFNKELEITTSGDCVHIRASVAAFPKNLDTATAVVKEMFK